MAYFWLNQRGQSRGYSDEFSLDGTGSVQPESDGRIDLEEWDSWGEVELDVSIDVGDEVIEHVFAPWEYEEPPAELVVAVRCRDTYLRERHVVEDNPVLPGTHEDTITIKLLSKAEQKTNSSISSARSRKTSKIPATEILPRRVPL